QRPSGASAVDRADVAGVQAGLVVRTAVAAVMDLADGRDADKAFILRGLDGTGTIVFLWTAWCRFADFPWRGVERARVSTPPLFFVSSDSRRLSAGRIRKYEI